MVEYPGDTPSDVEMRRLAEQFGVGRHVPQDAGRRVFFGAAPGETVPDPFFGGVGPDRTGCVDCGECMTGCRHGAKNTLVKNYLGLAEQAGARVHPLTTVTGVRPLPGGGYAVDTQRTGRWLRRTGPTFTAEQVVFAAGTYNTQKLLHRLRATTLPRHLVAPGLPDPHELRGAARAYGWPSRRTTTRRALPSPRPGTRTRTRTSSRCRYGKGSNAMGLLNTVLTDGGTRRSRWLQFAATLLRRPALVRLLVPRRWSERVIILLVMQSLNNSITVQRKRFGRLTSVQGEGEPNPTWIPVANRAAEQLAQNVDGMAGGTWGDLMNIPMTAHFIGGCAIGDSPATGVIDPYHRLYGYAGLHVVDGSALSANLGVNPSLSITAQAERAMALWPNRGEADQRPAPDQPYQRLDPVPPVAPVVPETAPAALRHTTGAARACPRVACPDLPSGTACVRGEMIRAAWSCTCLTCGSLSTAGDFRFGRPAAGHGESTERGTDVPFAPTVHCAARSSPASRRPPWSRASCSSTAAPARPRRQAAGPVGRPIPRRVSRRQPDPGSSPTCTTRAR